MAQRKRKFLKSILVANKANTPLGAGLITRRTLDRNQVLLLFSLFFWFFSLAHSGRCFQIHMEEPPKRFGRVPRRYTLAS